MALCIDWDFVSRREGGRRLRGYVPGTEEKSGVTVATGVDLGQRVEADIEALDIGRRLKETLKPYALKTRGEARWFLKENPLTLTEAEARQLDKAVGASILRTLIKNYDSAAAELGYDAYFIQTPKHDIIDDHRPLQRAGIRAILVMDFDYPHWDSTEDTLDKVSAESLAIVGNTAVRVVRVVDR